MLDKAKARVRREVQTRPWLDHVIRAGGSYQRQRGDYFAAGITYFTVLSLFPLLMVAFAVAGFVLARDPELLNELRDKIVQNIPGSFGTQINDLIDQAIRSRASVGVIGLLGAAYGGLGWMANLRAALTEQWEQPAQQGNWFRTKLSDLLALGGLGLAMVVSLGLSALSSSGLARQLLENVGLDQVPGVPILLRLVSLVLAVAASWAVFVWIIARLPRQPVTLRSAIRAGFIAAVAFELWKQVASFYLQKVLTSPAGVAFGSIIGFMVFAYITARIILFATAWAATARENELEAEIPAPAPAVIEPRMYAGMTATTGAALFGVGAVLGSLVTTRRKR
ncbi:inner membrane protein YhjD [Nocardia spumae]|uniref:inner membrane protein YhjD n=1 Tax=Nocardia spumae TaxID=2887190 RepID=UPI001D1478DB|nr:inner membrane protein YhjD [Nocardia spumae]